MTLASGWERTVAGLGLVALAAACSGTPDSGVDQLSTTPAPATEAVAAGLESSEATRGPSDLGATGSPGESATAPVGGQSAETEPTATENATAAVCDPPERVPVQGGEHLIGDQQPPVPYNSTPPTSGWHASGSVPIAVQSPTEPLTEPQQVSVLEAEGVVVAYRDLQPRQVRALSRMVERRFAGRAAVTPYRKLDPGQVALTTWGKAQRCDGLNLDVVARFIDRHAAPAPTTGHDP